MSQSGQQAYPQKRRHNWVNKLTLTKASQSKSAVIFRSTYWLTSKDVTAGSTNWPHTQRHHSWVNKLTPHTHESQSKSWPQTQLSQLGQKADPKHSYHSMDKKLTPNTVITVRTKSWPQTQLSQYGQKADPKHSYHSKDKKLTPNRHQSGQQVDPTRKCHGQQADPTRKCHGQQADPTRRCHGQQADPTRRCHSQQADPTRRWHSQQADPTHTSQSSWPYTLVKDPIHSQEMKNTQEAKFSFTFPKELTTQGG